LTGYIFYLLANPVQYPYKLIFYQKQFFAVHVMIYCSTDTIY